ncbi:MAG: hypothetical protein GF388_03345 [Candidatus Aegiribacteria sp.]|nr:hypothetical protein [Candidatus Aegiribacteria sp.]MBD3294302.1 hypothetical protein [Candidatus Fermentibacteria bacterium]
MTREEILEIVEAVLDQADVQDVVAKLTEERDAFVRFGQNSITQNMDTFERKLHISLGDGERKCTYSTHRIDVDAVPQILEKARGMLDSSAPDPEYMPAVQAGQVYPVVDSWDEETAELKASTRTETAASAISEATERGMEASGLVGNSLMRTAIGTSTGNLAFHESTTGLLRLTMDRGLASSYRMLTSEAWADLALKETIRRVADEVEADEGQKELEPGSYRLIFEPEATGNLVPFLLWSLNARQADEGLTVFSERMNEKVAGDNFTMRSQVNGELKGVPFNDEALAAQDVVWIDSGTLVNQPCDRYWARKTGRPPLFIPNTVAIDGGESSVEDLIGGVKGRALLFRRFWYIRFVDQKELSLTGMTRDGVFLVENGRIVHPLKDFRWNWKPLDLFSRIEKMGETRKLGKISVPSVVVGPTEF